MSDNRGGASCGGKLTHHFPEGTEPSEALLSMIYALENINPMDPHQEIGFQLYNYTNPEALNTLFATRSNDPIHVEFDIPNYHVEISGSREIWITVNWV